MRIPVAISLVAILLLCGGLPAHAGWPDYSPSYVTEVSGGIYLTPAGTGPSLEEEGLSLELLVEDFNYGILPDFPREDLWIECAQAGDIAFCAGGNIADHDTDSEGRTSFTLAPRGGGHSQMGLTVFIAGNPVGVGEPHSSQFVLSISINSPDINGDLVVDLSDIALFSEDLELGNEFRSDFNHDRVVNLSDIAILARALGDECP